MESRERAQFRLSLSRPKSQRKSQERGRRRRRFARVLAEGDAAVPLAEGAAERRADVKEPASKKEWAERVEGLWENTRAGLVLAPSSHLSWRYVLSGRCVVGALPVFTRDLRRRATPTREKAHCESSLEMGSRANATKYRPRQRLSREWKYRLREWEERCLARSRDCVEIRAFLACAFSSRTLCFRHTRVVLVEVL